MDISAIVERLDMRYLIDTLVDIAQVPTDVPLGPNVFMAPNDPKLVHYVQHIVRPKLTALGAYDLIEVPDNQLVARYGLGASDATLLLMVYTPIQHHNLMDDPSQLVSRRVQTGALMNPACSRKASPKPNPTTPLF